MDSSPYRMTCTILLTKLRRANLQTSFSNELSRLLEDLLCFLKIINVSTDQIICLCLSDLLNDCSKAIDKQLDKSQTRNQTKRNSLILCDLYPRFHAITRDLTQLRLRQNQLRAEYHKACQTANPISPESTTSNLHHFEQSEGEEVDLDESDFESICPPEEDLDHFSCISNHSSSSEVSPSSKDPPYSARPTTPNYTPESPISPSPSSSLRLVLPDSYSCRGVTIVNHTITVVRKEVSLYPISSPFPLFSSFLEWMKGVFLWRACSSSKDSSFHFSVPVTLSSRLILCFTFHWTCQSLHLSSVRFRWNRRRSSVHHHILSSFCTLLSVLIAGTVFRVRNLKGQCCGVRKSHM